MKRVYQSTDYYSAQLIKSYLEDNGIDANVSGELLIGAIGEIPANSYPSVWVIDEDDFDRAKALIAKYEESMAKPLQENTNWLCPHCGEKMELQFTQCWNCGTVRPNQ